MAMFGTIGRVFNSPKLKKRNFDPQKMSIEDIHLPRVFKQLERDELRRLVKDEIDTFKALDYKNKPDDQLTKPEYHSWQMGVVLQFLKNDMVYLYNQIDSILPSKTVYITKKNLHIKVFDIVYHYDHEVKKDLLVEELKQDVRWSAQDMAYLLRYATIEDRIIPKVKS